MGPAGLRRPALGLPLYRRMLTQLEVVSKRRSWLLGRARHLGRTLADAEDVVQEAFLRFMATFPEAPERLTQDFSSAWLLSTATNYTYDQCRRRRVRERSVAELALDPELAAAPGEPELQSWELISNEQLAEALRRLSPAVRTVVEMRLDGRKNGEIARQLGISPGAAAKRLHDGCLKLRRLLMPMFE